MKSEKSSPLECMINTVNWIGIVIMGLALASFLVTITVIVNKKPIPISITNLELSYKLNADSLIKNNVQFDEKNKLLLEEINKTLTSYDVKIKSIIAAEEDKNKWFTYVTGFLSILIAFATFFGFKSVFEMKKEAVETAEREAKAIAEKKAESTSKMEINKQMFNIKEDLELSLKTLLTAENKKVIEDELKSKMDEIDALLLKANQIVSELEQRNETRTIDDDSLGDSDEVTFN